MTMSQAVLSVYLASTMTLIIGQPIDLLPKHLQGQSLHHVSLKSVSQSASSLLSQRRKKGESTNSCRGKEGGIEGGV